MKLTHALPALAVAMTLNAQAFEVTSQDIQEGHPMAKTFEFSGMGCDGANVSPQLTWKQAPAGTKSFAITAYDPDAPTGSGWWHWVVLNVPATTNALPRGASGNIKAALETQTDYGKAGFGGACPPEGHGMHRYQFTVWALPKAQIDLPADTPPAVVGYTLNSLAIDKATLTATYTR
ncbi:YbhB/YbcL family Raf kinase inhibitor-like protein [Endozoicomonas numazuensis]|uniref:Kinase inhibitor n=1 Tax=Endozoicomonas numazuensis TaxID=1137799 RepID=A0A081N6H2_9GAMM|nr:YbhB/YbcL family Raf kinase inhibitor-like protein [Endozoicomonas numazuensis]KEQ14045.1 kinase inhibitor [Endozoicomonas numazuensis]